MSLFISSSFYIRVQIYANLLFLIQPFRISVRLWSFIHLLFVIIWFIRHVIFLIRRFVVLIFVGFEKSLKFSFCSYLFNPHCFVFGLIGCPRWFVSWFLVKCFLILYLEFCCWGLGNYLVFIGLALIYYFNFAICCSLGCFGLTYH